MRAVQCPTCTSTEECLHPAGGRCPDPWHLPIAMGVGRMADNDQAILVHFRRRPTDDELRDLHELLAGRVVATRSEKSAPLDQTIRLLIKGWESADDADHCNMLRNVDAALGEYVSAPSAIETPRGRIQARTILRYNKVTKKIDQVTDGVVTRSFDPPEDADGF